MGVESYKRLVLLSFGHKNSEITTVLCPNLLYLLEAKKTLLCVKVGSRVGTTKKIAGPAKSTLHMRTSVSGFGYNDSKNLKWSLPIIKI